MVVLIILAICLFTFGIVFLKGKGAFLIAGYNTASPEEKEKINLKRLFKYMAVMMFLNAACISGFALSIIFDNNIILYISLFMLIALDIILIVVMNTKNRLKND